MRSTKQDPVTSRASLGVAAFLVAAPLLACSATVVGRVFGQTAKGSPVRPTNSDDADGTSALLQGSRVRPTDSDDADGTSALLQEPLTSPRTTSPRTTSPRGSGSAPPTPRANQEEDTMSDSLSV